MPNNSLNAQLLEKMLKKMERLSKSYFIEKDQVHHHEQIMIKTACLSILFLLCLSCKVQKSESNTNDSITTPSEDWVIEWISDHAKPLSSVLAGSGTADLRPLNVMIGNARIVSLDEPTHGNREVFQLKQRMIENLVTDLGFNVFALECPFGEEVSSQPKPRLKTKKTK